MPSITEFAYEAPVMGFITTGVPVVKLTDTVGEAATKYELNPSNRSLLVVDSDGVLAGLVTDKDLTKLIDQSRNDPVSVLISSPEVVAVRNSANLGQLLRIMNGENPSGLSLDIVPVVDGDTRPLGVIKRSSLTADLSERLSRGDFRKPEQLG
jgi:CBS domain-containing protein